MKKIISLSLAVMLLVSTIPSVYAADTNNYDQGTQVVYTANGAESYTVTVPAVMQPGQTSEVKLEGTWAENRVVNVTADATVTLVNSINSQDTKILNIDFVGGISATGSNVSSQTFTKPISVANISDALFGEWRGTFNYNVSTTDAVRRPMFAIMHKPSGSVTKPAENETFSIYGFDMDEGYSDNSEDINYTAGTYSVKAEAFDVVAVGTKDIVADFYGEQSTFKLPKALSGLTAEELGEYTLIVDWNTYETWVDFAIKTFTLPNGSTIDIPSICYAYKYADDTEVVFGEDNYIPLYGIDESTNTFYLTTRSSVVQENMKLFVDGRAALTNIILVALGFPEV